MFLDIGVGILVSIIVSYFFKIDFNIWLLFFSIVFALLPDADFLYGKLKKNKIEKAYQHRDIIHYPLPYILAGIILLGLFTSKAWVIIFVANSLLHFIHDSIAYGRGIKWVYPFNKNSLSFFYLYSRSVKKGLWQWVFIFDKKRTLEFDEEHGDENWVENIYYKWHPIAQVEFGFFIVSLIILYFYVK